MRVYRRDGGSIVLAGSPVHCSLCPAETEILSHSPSHQAHRRSAWEKRGEYERQREDERDTIMRFADTVTRRVNIHAQHRNSGNIHAQTLEERETHCQLCRSDSTKQRAQSCSCSKSGRPPSALAQMVSWPSALPPLQRPGCKHRDPS